MSLDADVRVELGQLNLAIELTAGDAETVVVLGPNGAGKTTLLRALAGLVPLDAGHVVLDDVVLDDPAAGTWVPTEQRRIGYVFQDYVLFPHLSALDNVAFGLRARGVARRTARATALGWLERLGLGDHARLRPAALSGGQAQRVALARALALEPRLLLLDEPLAALDATVRAETRRELRHQLREFHGARLLVTHDPVDALALGDRVVVVENGAVVQSGAPAELREAPRSRYVADLIGVNLFTGALRGDRLQVADGAELVVVNDHNITGDALAVFEPSAVSVHGARPPAGSPRNCWEGAITDVHVDGQRARSGLTLRCRSPRRSLLPRSRSSVSPKAQRCG